MSPRLDTAPATARRPAVAGSFYPADPDQLAQLMERLLESVPPSEEAVAAVKTGLAGILVPHAGLAYSGRVAATAWALAAGLPVAATTIVMLGTNHFAGWLDGVGVWDAGAWQTPLGDVELDESLAADIVALGSPFEVDRAAHGTEHSLEVQLPFVQVALSGARIVPLAVGTGRGDLAIAAGERLGRLLAERRSGGADIRLAISTDMAHYPPAEMGAWVTEELAPLILALDPARLAHREADIVRSGIPGVACGMCGIEPAVVGLAALRAMGIERGVRVASATSADAGGPPGRTVGYLAAAFPADPRGAGRRA